MQRLLVVALRPIAIEEPDVARELLEPLAIDGVDAGLTGGRHVGLHARRQDRQRRRDAEHLEEVVVPRARRLPVGGELVVGQRDERLAVVVRLGRIPLAVLQDERRPGVPEVDVQEARGPRGLDRHLAGDAPVVRPGLPGAERRQRRQLRDRRPRRLGRDGRRGGRRGRPGAVAAAGEQQ